MQSAARLRVLLIQIYVFYLYKYTCFTYTNIRDLLSFIYVFYVVQYTCFTYVNLRQNRYNQYQI